MRTSRVTSWLGGLVLLVVASALQADVERAHHLCDRCGGGTPSSTSRRRASRCSSTPGMPGPGGARRRAHPRGERCGLSRIDRLIAAHFHADHVGGIAEVAARIPVAEFIDHGPNVQPGGRIDAVMQRSAARSPKAKRTVAKPGDRIPIGGLKWRIVASVAPHFAAPL